MVATDNLSNQELLVPRAICGLSRASKSRWRAVARRAIAAGSWSRVLTAADLVPVDSVAGDIVIGGPYPSFVGEGVAAFQVMAGLYHESMKASMDDSGELDREAWYSRMISLFDVGLPEFWFSLGVLGCGSTWFPINTRYDSKLRDVALRTLRRP